MCVVFNLLAAWWPSRPLEFSVRNTTFAAFLGAAEKHRLPLVELTGP